MNKEFFIQSNEFEKFGLKFLFFKGAKPNKIFVSFGSMGGGDKYSRWSWFWNNNNYSDSYLFLLDKNDTYFLGKSGNSLVESYMDAINWALDQSNLTPNQMVMIGNSMGGYAALYYGLKLNAKYVFVGNPQVSRKSAISGSKTWLKCMNQAENFVDISEVYQQSNKITQVLVEVGSHSADILAAKELYNIFDDKRNIIINMHAQYPHLFDLPKKATIEKLSISNNFDTQSTKKAISIGSFLSFNSLLDLNKIMPIDVVASSKYTRIDSLLEYGFLPTEKYLNTANELKNSLQDNEKLWIDSDVDFLLKISSLSNKECENIDLILLDNYIEISRKMAVFQERKFLLSNKIDLETVSFEDNLMPINSVKDNYNSLIIFLLKKFKNAKIVLINAPLLNHKDAEISARSIIFDYDFSNKKAFIVHANNSPAKIKNGIFDYGDCYKRYALLLLDLMNN